MKHAIAALAATFALAVPALGHDYTLNGLTIGHPMAYETPVTARSGAGYLSITNEGDTADRLIAVRADFPQVMIHTTEMTDGVARMLHVDGIDLPPGETVTLEPGGYHVMFMGLDGDPLEQGEKIAATLVFEQAGEIEVTFNVEARPEGGAHSHDHGHGDGKHSH